MFNLTSIDAQASSRHHPAKPHCTLTPAQLLRWETDTNWVKQAECVTAHPFSTGWVCSDGKTDVAKKHSCLNPG